MRWLSIVDLCGMAWQSVAGGRRCRQDNLGSIRDKACTGSARPNQGHFAQDQPFVSKDNEDVGWLECCLYHTLIILWNDTFWIYTIQATAATRRP